MSFACRPNFGYEFGDIFNSNVVLRFHADGTDGSTTFTDT